MGGRVCGMRPICTFPITINTCSMIAGRILAGILRPISTSYISTTLITMMINYTIARGRVAVLLRPKSTSSIACRHSKTSIIVNTIVVTMVQGWMDDLSRPISKTSINTHVEISKLAVFVTHNFVGAYLLSVSLTLTVPAFTGFYAG